jgi:hypothetical protein
MKDTRLLGLVDNWVEYLQGDDQGSHNRLLMAIRSGQLAGSEQFVKLIEKLTGCDLSLRKPGRPMKTAS